MGAEEVEFTTKEVALHNQRSDCWMTIRGEGEQSTYSYRTEKYELTKPTTQSTMSQNT